MSMPTMPQIENMNIGEAIKLLVASMAEEEKAMAQLLDAEKNKILYAIRKNASSCDMLKMNESVSEVVKSLVKLEMLLDFRLDKIKRITEDLAKSKCVMEDCSDVQKFIHQGECFCCLRCF